MRVDMRELTPEGVLAGALDGQEAFLTVLSKCSSAPQNPEPLVLDFGGIQLATASYLREFFFGIRDHMRARRSTWYPVLANVNANVEDELSILTQAGKDAVILCKCDKTGAISEPSLFGELDPKHERTFELVVEHGEKDADAFVDAGTLVKAYGRSEQLENISAWNNRLRTLADRGVLMEFTKGRAKSYRPAW